MPPIYPLCEKCFENEGIRMTARRLGRPTIRACSSCKQKGGVKLNKEQLEHLAFSYFVRGSVSKSEYGGAPMIQFNEFAENDVSLPHAAGSDMEKLSRTLGIGFFDYGPRVWMLGEIEPLKQLLEPASRQPVVERVIKEYPTRLMAKGEQFYRIRKNPDQPSDKNEYDTAPFPGSGRFNANGSAVLYGSQSLDVCLHECRVTAEDELYVATLRLRQELRLLDLSAILHEDVTEFDSLDQAMSMLFYAPEHAYEPLRAIAKAIKEAGFDGIIYPSYFSSLSTGRFKVATILGISVRQFRDLQAASSIIPNLAMFGYPLAEKKLECAWINRVYLKRVVYDVGFGPLLDSAEEADAISPEKS